MNRTLSLAALTILVFVVTVALLTYLIPGPHKPTDYLVIGAVATFACLLLLFVLLIKTNKPRP